MRHRATSLRDTASGAGLTIEFVPTQGSIDDRDVRRTYEADWQEGQHHDGTESSRARPGGTSTHVAHRAYTMTERRAHEPGDGGFLYVLGMYRACISMCPVQIHRDTFVYVTLAITSYLNVTSRFNIKSWSKLSRFAGATLLVLPLLLPSCCGT